MFPYLFTRFTVQQQLLFYDAATSDLREERAEQLENYKDASIRLQEWKEFAARQRASIQVTHILCRKLSLEPRQAKKRAHKTKLSEVKTTSNKDTKRKARSSRSRRAA